MSLEVWYKLLAYVLGACPSEVNGFGYVEQIDDDIFRITDVFVAKQSASGSHAEADAEALMQRCDLTKLRFQWHSHSTMEAYFSDTDVECIEVWPGDQLISLVLNVRGEYTCRVDTYETRMGVEVPIEITTEIPLEVLRSAKAELDKLVDRPLVGRRRRDSTTPHAGQPTGMIPTAILVGEARE